MLLYVIFLSPIFFKIKRLYLPPSAWALAQTTEFVLSTVFQPLDLFPEVLGACGGVYLAEAVGGGGGDGGDLGAPSAAEAITGGQGGGFARWTGRVSEAYSVN